MSDKVLKVVERGRLKLVLKRMYKNDDKEQCETHQNQMRKGRDPPKYLSEDLVNEVLREENNDNVRDGAEYNF